MPAVEAIIRSLPLTLCHGDCNPGNVLFDADGAMVWTDWQEVRLARGPEDLSFFLQQAAIAGGVFSSEAALSAYRASLVAELHADVSLAAIRRVVDAAELRSRGLHWPAYLSDATAAELGGMLERLRSLTERLELET
jgi:aminoglycoside phosphotransferase (APT) family kinase protein